MPLDPRLHAYREDLADIGLRGIVKALKFVRPEPRQVCVSVAQVLSQPRFDAATMTEALYGERVRALEDKEGWTWCQLEGDSYVGYMPTRCLTTNTFEPTHRVAVASTVVYSKPDIKSNPVSHIHLNASVRVRDIEGDMARLHDHRYVWARHLKPLEERETDPCRIAEMFLHRPYLWGGKSAIGLDCSGLVQLAWQACGHDCPRDSDMMAAAFGDELTIDRGLRLERNDLVFWKGHLGIMQDSKTLLHANGYHMRVVSEPLAGAIKRIATMFGTITTVRRVADAQAKQVTADAASRSTTD